AARAAGGGVLLLVRTSNPGAADVEERELAAGGAVWERLAELVSELGEPGESGLSDVGAVLGAPAPERLPRPPGLMPGAPLLLPRAPDASSRRPALFALPRRGRGAGSGGSLACVACIAGDRRSPGLGPARGAEGDDHHGHAERRDRQVARGPELPPRAPSQDR